MNRADHPTGTVSRVENVLITPELARRPSRPPDYEAENQALGALAQQMAANSGGVLQRVAELVLELCHADSAGISILEPGGTDSIFRWHAAAGALAPHLGGTMPREDSPCSVVIERNSVLLFREAERYFAALRGIEPRMYENLLAPWQADGQTTGTPTSTRRGGSPMPTTPSWRWAGSAARSSKRAC